MGLDEEDLADILGPDVVAQLFELPSRFLRASSNDGEGEAIAEAQLELVGAFAGATHPTQRITINLDQLSF